IESQAPEVTLTIDIPGLEGYEVHGDPWALMTCSSPVTILTCTVSNLEASNGAVDVGFDVWVAGDFSLTATIDAADNNDPNPGNVSVSPPCEPVRSSRPTQQSEQIAAHEPAALYTQHMTD